MRHGTLLRQVYDAFNARDIDAALGAHAPRRRLAQRLGGRPRPGHARGPRLLDAPVRGDRLDASSRSASPRPTTAGSPSPSTRPCATSTATCSRTASSPTSTRCATGSSRAWTSSRAQGDRPPRSLEDEHPVAGDAARWRCSPPSRSPTSSARRADRARRPRVLARAGRLRAAAPARAGRVLRRGQRPLPRAVRAARPDRRGRLVALIALYTVVAYSPGALGTACAVVGALLAALRWDRLGGQRLTGPGRGHDRGLGRCSRRRWAPGGARAGRSSRRCASATRLLAIERDQQAALERARIARELHDVIAHSLSVIVVQADGAAAGAQQRPDQAAARAAHDRRHGARGARPDAPAARGAARRRRRGARAPARHGAARRARRAGRARRRPGAAVARRPPARRGRRRRPDALPARPGGADQRPQARRRGLARRRRAALPRRRGRAAGARRRPRRAGRRRRARAGPGRDARAGRAARRHARGRAERAGLRGPRGGRPHDARLPRRRPGARPRRVPDADRRRSRTWRSWARPRTGAPRSRRSP